jgi:hypothetical protein
MYFRINSLGQFAAGRRLLVALVGWYLMVPPETVGVSGPRYDLTAPLSKWTAFQSFDTAHECEGAKFLHREGAKQRKDPMLEALVRAQCIATDDSRLRP